MTKPIAVYRLAGKFGHQVDLPAPTPYLRDRAAEILRCNINDAPAFVPPIRAGQKSGSQDVSGKQARPIGANTSQQEDLPKHDI